MKYAFFPGCSVHASMQEYGVSCRAINDVLNVDMIEIPHWNCCGAMDAIYAYKPLHSIALASRNLSLAEDMQMDLVTLCSACYYTLSRANKLLHDEPALKKKVDKVLRKAGLRYTGNVKVRHYLDVLINDVGLEEIAKHVKAPLKGLRAAPYYGCLLVRPKNPLDDPEQPKSLDNLIETLGATSVNFTEKLSCCGASMVITNEPIMLEMTKKILLSARDSKAQCIVTACPLCQFNIDVKQQDIESRFNLKIGIPTLYFTQLVGLAFDLNPRDLGLNRNIVSPTELLIPSLSAKTGVPS